MLAPGSAFPFSAASKQAINLLLHNPNSI
jgi:hypothetical protein